MLTIRFFRAGKKNQPFFRIVVTDKKNPPRGGRFVDMVGFFNPQTKEKSLKAERIKHWLQNGAQPSPRVHNLLVGEGILKEKKRPVHSKTKKQETSAKKQETGDSEAEQARYRAGKQETNGEKPAEGKPKEELKSETKQKPIEQEKTAQREPPKEQTKPEVEQKN